MARREEARATPAFRLVRIDRERLVIASARMCDMILASTDRPSRPRIDDIERQRRVHTYRRMQRGRLLPCAKAHARNEFADAPRRLQRQRHAVDRHLVTVVVQTEYVHFE